METYAQRISDVYATRRHKHNALEHLWAFLDEHHPEVRRSSDVRRAHLLAFIPLAIARAREEQRRQPHLAGGDRLTAHAWLVTSRPPARRGLDDTEYPSDSQNDRSRGSRWACESPVSGSRGGASGTGSPNGNGATCSMRSCSPQSLGSAGRTCDWRYKGRGVGFLTPRVRLGGGRVWCGGPGQDQHGHRLREPTRGGGNA